MVAPFLDDLRAIVLRSTDGKSLARILVPDAQPNSPTAMILRFSGPSLGADDVSHLSDFCFAASISLYTLIP